MVDQLAERHGAQAGGQISARRAEIACRATIIELTGWRMTGRLKGKLAFVTAAGQGIGRAIAEAFIAEGARVIATDLDADKLEGLQGRQVRQARRALERDVDALAKTITANSARPTFSSIAPAMCIRAPCSIAARRTGIFPSTSTSSRCIARSGRSCRPCWKEGGGSIINISSAVSSIRGVPNRYVYGATKAAVIGLTKAVAADFIKQGIRCNAICPGTIESPSLDGRIAAMSQATGRSSDAVRQDFIDRQPMGRLGTPQEVAALALFLASDESSYITGQAHLVDGGMAL